ncbi:MAG TPA: PadR family transcriptional regulator [Solirubrobacteraceae bacterium]|nr:PadR family transcriptional regulator [Solirubrobacteraceae bacterium]
MSIARLSETSYIVLALIERVQPATPYDLKRLAERSTIDFWAVPHAQLYSECARLAAGQLLTEEREEAGRRRRFYSLTDLGRRALQDWLEAPIDALEEVRDLGILKLFFGADPALLARTLLPMHEERLQRYEGFAELRDRARAAGTEIPRGAWLALQAGIGHEREYVRFWRDVLEGDTP